MNESKAPPAGLSARQPATSGSKVAHDRSGWTAGRVTALVTGALLVLVSLVLLGAGGTGLWAEWTQREDGYVTTDTHDLSTSGFALATEHTQLGAAGVGWLYSPGLLGKIRIRVTPVGAGKPLFVGIGRSSDVDRYLAGVKHTVVSDFFGDKSQTVAGGTTRSRPGGRSFWVASASGGGPQTLLWNPKKGSWSVVVMNADGRQGIAVKADLGARMPAVLWIAIGSFVAGAVFLVGGGLLIAGAVRRRRAAGGHEDEGRIHAER